MTRRRDLTPNLEPLEGRSLTSFTGPGIRPGPAHLVVCEGNSLTYGKGTDSPATQSYPAQLQAKLGDRWKVLNLGVPSQSTERMLWLERKTFAGISALQARLPNTVHQWGIDVVWEGTNSIRLHDTGEVASRALARFVAVRHSQQFKVVVLTCLPAHTTLVGPDFEAQRQIYNALIRKNARADLVVDVASDPRLTDPESAYYAPDHFHLSDAGYAIVTSLVSRAVQRLAQLPPPS